MKKNLIASKFMALRFFIIGVGLFLIIVIFQSCQEKLSDKTSTQQELSRKELIAEVLELYYNDHKYQRMRSVFEQNNSNCRGNGLGYYNWEKDEKRLAFELFGEDVMKVQYIKNTKRLIEITEQYGFPGMESLGHDIPVFLVFVHADEKYFEKIRKLIEQEYKAGRVSEFERDYIFWHLNGRYRGTGEPQPDIPYPINYRGSIEIFRGALVDDIFKIFQSFRNGPLYLEGDETIKINPKNIKDLSREKLTTEVKEIYFNDQKYRRMINVFEDINNKCKGSKINPYKSEDDKTRLAFWLFREDIIEPQDIKNTKRLLAFTKKYGFPGMERLDHDIPVFMVFAHTPYKYEIFDEVRKLVKKEFEAGRISKFAKDYILWHINGRMEATPPPIPDTIDYRTNIEVFKGALNDVKQSKTNANAT